MIDHGNPPVQDDSTVRPWEPPFGVPVFGGFMDQFSNSLEAPVETILYHFGDMFERTDYTTSDERRSVGAMFRHILQPYGPIVMDDLVDPSREGEVLGALHATLAFAASQLVNIEQRFDLDESSDSDPSTLPNEKNPISGTITDNWRQRVVQNSSITFTLMAILSLVALIHIWALTSSWRRSLTPPKRRPWMLNLVQRGVAPPGFSSLAMMASLLEGSNCASVMPENAHLMPPEELHQHLVGRQFRLGWFHNTETGTDTYTIGVLNEGSLVFKGDTPGLEKISHQS